MLGKKQKRVFIQSKTFSGWQNILYFEDFLTAKIFFNRMEKGGVKNIRVSESGLQGL